MNNMSGVKRAFPFTQVSASWCTKCSGLKCDEDVGFLQDRMGNVQGYIIDSEKLRNAIYTEYKGKNRRKNNVTPYDRIYKRPSDVKELVSRNPRRVNNVKFSNDVLNRILVGVEGCDDFIKGSRDVPCERVSEDAKSMNLDKKAAEVLSGTTEVIDIKLVRGYEKLNYRLPNSNPLTRGY